MLLGTVRRNTGQSGFIALCRLRRRASNEKMDSESEEDEYEFDLVKSVFLRTGQSPLTAACLDGKKTLVACLLRNGADPNVCDHTGMYPLHAACLSMPSAAILESLLTNGADPNRRVSSGEDDGETPLHYVIRDLGKAGTSTRIKFTYILLKSGASPDIRSRVIDPLIGRRSVTVREYAASKGRKRLLKILKAYSKKSQRNKSRNKRVDEKSFLEYFQNIHPLVVASSLFFFGGIMTLHTYPKMAGVAFGTSIFSALLFVVTAYQDALFSKRQRTYEDALNDGNTRRRKTNEGLLQFLQKSKQD